MQKKVHTMLGAAGMVLLMALVVAVASRLALWVLERPDKSVVPDAPPIEGVPGRGTVGYLGDPEKLRVIDSNRKLPPASSWDRTLRALRVDGEDLILDGVHLKGGIDFYGGGTLTIRNSIIEGGWGTWFVIVARTSGATIDVRDSTLRWREASTPSAGSGNAAIQVLDKVRIIALRNDISGTADGIQIAGDDSRIEQNWIHDLAAVGNGERATHNDGIQVFHGQRIVIAQNRIELGFDGVHQNAAVFLQPGNGATIDAPQIIGNFLQGGGYPLRIEGAATTDVVVAGNTFGSLETEAFGFAYVLQGATISAWKDNHREEGGVVTQPACRHQTGSSSGSKPSDASCSAISAR